MKALLIMAMALLAGYPAPAQQPTNNRNEAATAAAGVVANTKVARQALANHDTRTALERISQALALADQARNLAGGAEPAMVTLSGEMEAESTMVPAKRHSYRLKHNSSVSDVTGEYTSTTLNVTTARNELEAARTALNNGDSSAADADLASAEAAVVTRHYSGELPLVEARDNLNIARQRILAGKYKDTILPLKSAARALDRFAQQQPRPRNADMAERMRIDIDAYAERIGRDHSEALDRVAGWSDQVNKWFNGGMPE